MIVEALCLEPRRSSRGNGLIQAAEDGRMVDQGETPEVVRHIQIVGELDPHAAESLQLEIRRLANRFGVDVREFRIEKVSDRGGDSGGEETAG